MKGVLIDIDVLMDFLYKREGYEAVDEIIKFCFREYVKIFMCANDLTTLMYFRDKEESDKVLLKRSMRMIKMIFRPVELNDELIEKALLSKIDNFEDALVEVSAIESGVDYILTRNTNDYRESKVPAKTPEEFLALIK